MSSPMEGAPGPYLADALRAVVGGKPWYGPAMLESVENLDPEAAASRPIADAHSIWELVLHIGAWADIVHERVKGQPPAVTMARNFPPVDEVSDDAWSRAIEEMVAQIHALADTVAALDAAQLWQERPELKRIPGEQVQGVVEHAAYHAGQINLLRRALGIAPPPS